MNRRRVSRGMCGSGGAAKVPGEATVSTCPEIPSATGAMSGVRNPIRSRRRQPISPPNQSGEKREAEIDHGTYEQAERNAAAVAEQLGRLQRPEHCCDRYTDQNQEAREQEPDCC